MFSQFFIDRPIFASVLSIVITLGGTIAIFTLPVTQYPDITPPTVEVFATYPGANAEVVAATVAAPIEQQVNGVEGMMYMSSQCTNDGKYTLTVTFKPGTDLNMAQILVQNKAALAQPILPDLVQRRGVTVKKKSPSVLMIVNLYSPQGTRNNLYLSNYATIRLRDELSRLPGIGDITFLGQRDYSMRIWLDPAQMAARSLSATDVITAVEQQNVQVAAGQIGQPPAPTNQAFQYTMNTLGRVENPAQFGEMILKADARGRTIRLKDVAKIELGALTYDQICTLDEQPSVALSIYQLPGFNALETAANVRDKMADLQTRFPSDVNYAIVYDTTPFIDESIREVRDSLRDAILLVAVVVLIFLQGWRAAVIPLIAVPVAIVGTFAAMAAFGFSLNTLTLFGLVLAIGIVVDDAVVVVEAIEHHIELGEAPRDAAIHAMDEVSGPVIAVALVLSAVFIPCIFITGIVGEFFRQFAVTIAISTVISAFNSLTLSPALAVLLLKPKNQGHLEALPKFLILLVTTWAGYALLPELAAYLPQSLPAAVADALPWIGAGAGFVLGWLGSGVINRGLGGFFRGFNRMFNWLSDGYVSWVNRFLRTSALVLLLYGGLLYLTYGLFSVTPTGFIPQQDKGYLLMDVRLQDGASLNRTGAMMGQIEQLAKGVPGVSHTLAIAGQSVLSGATAANFGTMYVMLDEFHKRSHAGLSADEIADKLREKCEEAVPDGTVNIVGAPPIDGLGTAGGFKIVVQDPANLGLQSLQQATEKIVADARADAGLTNAFTSFRGDTPWYYIDIDRTAAKTMGVSMTEVFNTLQVYFGSLYVNDFNRFGRTWQVNIQADAHYRMKVEDLQRVKVRNNKGEMVPFASLFSVRPVSGPLMLLRYNLYSAASINANAGPGTSSGQAIKTLGAIADKDLLPTQHSEWTELALLQLNVGNTAMFAFSLSVVLVFLVLAAQYESWSLPLAVILVVPLCLLCSIVGVIFAHMDINIFTQIGFVVLVGLACKNAILIVEFARARRNAGADRRAATLEACRLRLRPIIMTSFAFILGVVPLIVGTGAGAEMRRTLGTAVFAGMLGVTLFGIFLTPVFYYVIQWFSDWRQARRQEETTALEILHNPPPH
ncbi:MAG TPA: multidrug efflux RND transporter permease subunit [Pirellulales bacterium]|jgi:multidrug efflux pump|nr:multidrug efflux RND transporter permease subunit [Pirellulales bacterium]